MIDDRWVAAARGGGASPTSPVPTPAIVPLACGRRIAMRWQRARQHRRVARSPADEPDALAARRRALALDRRANSRSWATAAATRPRACCATDTATAASCARSASILRDQLSSTSRSAASTRSARAGRRPARSAGRASTTSAKYQATVARPVPLFRRRPGREAPRDEPRDERVEARTATSSAVRVREDHSPAAFASSFGAEDMVLFDLIARDGLAIDVFTLDTGRLPHETHQLIDGAQALRHLRRRLLPMRPTVEAFVERNGSNGFYAASSCARPAAPCASWNPLRARLAGKRALDHGPAPRPGRHAADGSRSRNATPRTASAKFNPLADWTDDEVWAYLRATTSPTTRCTIAAIRGSAARRARARCKPGEDPRAGRWWWEQRRAQGMRAARDPGESRGDGA